MVAPRAEIIDEAVECRLEQQPQSLDHIQLGAQGGR
jgi:hypothetical protein